MKQENNDSTKLDKSRQDELLEKLEANRQKLLIIANDVKLKNELLAKLNAERKELNRLYPGAGGKQ